MKYLLLGLFLIPSFCKAQDSLLYNVFPLKDGKATFEKVVIVDSANKNELYNRAKAWALTYYVSQKDALQTDDKESGIVAYKGYFSQTFQSPTIMGIKPYPMDYQYWEIIKILVKDGRAKIIVTDIKVKVSGSMGGEFAIEEYPDYQEGIYKGKYKNYKKKADEANYANFKIAGAKILHLISEIEDYLTGKKKSDTDF